MCIRIIQAFTCPVLFTDFKGVGGGGANLLAPLKPCIALLSCFPQVLQILPWSSESGSQQLLSDRATAIPTQFEGSGKSEWDEFNDQEMSYHLVT